MKTETLTFDVIVVGAGPAGLATAHHVRTLSQAHGLDLSVCLLDKAARIGGHLLSGALLDPRILTTLIPDWATPQPDNRPPLGPAPLDSPVLDESLWFLTHRRAHALPLPKAWRHDQSGLGCHMVSLGTLCRWLAHRAEQQGVEIFPGFAAVAPVWEGDQLVGIISGDQGRDHTGQPKPGFQPGVILRAPITVLAEGCRGSLSGTIIRQLGLDRTDLPGQRRSPQRYALGFKELWETPGSPPGAVLHTLGWPLEEPGQHRHGGGFLYQPRPNRTVLGMVIDLDYTDPRFDPFMAAQQWKSHPLIRPRLQSARLLGYGARTLAIGGWQSLPQLAFAGGLLVGDAAGLLNTATLQGIGNALASGILAAETIITAFASQDFSAHTLHRYTEAVRQSSWGRALHAVRNIRPGFRAGLWPGLLHALWEKGVGGRSPWTLHWRQTDRERLHPVDPLAKPLPPPRLVHPLLDRATALAGSGLHYTANQPAHLHWRDPLLPPTAGYTRFDNPELRFCPAGVFTRHTRSDGKIFLQMHANHCLHCKCCDIKDPLDNVCWTAPEGGSGPDYQEM
ncbi:MAG: 4Fe-4S dicluster domain-containing protein [Magnetococcales bacterium]|nr:4Fe-4S dicluster domain-containing protein [Magnetococcales bacterium]